MPRKKDPAAVELGRRGGKKIAKRGSEYFRKLQAKQNAARAVDPRNLNVGKKDQPRSMVSETHKQRALAVNALAIYSLANFKSGELPWQCLRESGRDSTGTSFQ